jgi:hydroxypyruvate isomerase
MLRFCANLAMLFREVDFLERFDAAARAGFNAVEFPFPYAYDEEVLAERLQRHGLTQVLFNLPAGDWANGERGIACHPGRVGEFQDGVGRAIDYARNLGCTRVNCLSGIAPPGVDPERLHETLVSNLAFAAGSFSEAGMLLLVEPINTRDMPGFQLHHADQAVCVMDAVGVDNIRLQYDIYHMQVMEGDLAKTVERLFDRIGHFQLADNPGRHEPGTGEINYPFLLDFIDQLGYDGWIGCEYVPTGDTVESLSWMAPYR